MVAISATLVAVRLRRIGGFSAPDPWAGGKPRRWDINLYRMVSETFASQLEWSVIKPKRPGRPARGGDPGPGGRGLRWLEEVGIAPDGDTRYRLMPRALYSLWAGREVHETLLPGILAALETELKRRDFRFSRGRLFVCAFVALPVVFDLAWLVRVAPTALTGARVPSGFATPIVLPAVARAMAVLPPLAILFALLALLAALEFRVRRRDRSIATRIRALAAEAGTATTTIRSQGA